jgi:serine/threonine-protein kinase
VRFSDVLLCLPRDLRMTPVTELPADLLTGIDVDPGDYVLSRPAARTAAQLVDREAMRLLQEFGLPRGRTEACRRYAQAAGRDLSEVLRDATPLITRLVSARLLTTVADEESMKTLDVGEVVAGFTVLARVGGAYRVRCPRGGIGALKLARSPLMRDALRREAEILSRLDEPLIAPLIGYGVRSDDSYLVTAWIEGECVDVCATRLRAAGCWAKLEGLLGALSESYARLHGAFVVHGDVHPGNALARPDGGVTLIDFGFARAPGLAVPPRTGLACYVEPEYAHARLTGQPMQPVTFASEQFSLAVLLFQLATAHHPLELRLDRVQAFHQICTQPARSFKSTGAPASPRVEAALRIALAKDPRSRHTSVDHLGGILRGRKLRRGSRGEDPVADGCSVATGSAGVALALLSDAMRTDDPRKLECADVWASRASRQLTRTSSTSLLHGATGVHLAALLVACARGETTAVTDAARALGSADMPSNGFDLASGAAGMLFASALCLDALPAHIPADTTPVTALGERAMSHLWMKLDAMPDLRRAPTMPFGMAHGWAGCLYATFAWMRAAHAAAPRGLTTRLAQLADVARPTSRGLVWPLDHDRATAWVGWCHGSAGYVPLWLAATAAGLGARWAGLAERAGLSAAEAHPTRGDICCGCAGQARAMLALYRSTGDATWLTRMQRLLRNAPPATGPGLLHGRLGVRELVSAAEAPDGADIPLVTSA